MGDFVFVSMLNLRGVKWNHHLNLFFLGKGFSNLAKFLCDSSSNPTWHGCYAALIKRKWEDTLNSQEHKERDRRCVNRCSGNDKGYHVGSMLSG